VRLESTPGEDRALRCIFRGDRTSSQGRRNAAARSLPTAGQRVLYVDDEEALVLLAERFLSRLGHKISGFTDATKALKAFARIRRTLTWW